MKQVLLKVSEDVKLTTHTEYLKETCLGKEQWNEIGLILNMKNTKKKQDCVDLKYKIKEISIQWRLRKCKQNAKRHNNKINK